MNGTFVESRKYIMLLKLQWALPKEKDTISNRANSYCSLFFLVLELVYLPLLSAKAYSHVERCVTI